MENIQPISLINCSFCEIEINTEDSFCTSCGYPEKGTEEDVAKFIGNRKKERIRIDKASKKIESARNTLFIISGIVVVFGIINYLILDSITVLIINFILCCLYLLLGAWSTQKPLIALLLGLFLYITTVVISAIIDPATLVKGVLWKIIIIGYLGKGIYSASSIKN